MKKVIATTCLAFSFALGGCATIVGDSTQTIPISSTPSEAQILITDEKGMQVFKGSTPTSVTLQKSDGSYWGGKSFTVEITKDGYATQTIPVNASANGWYIGGNIIFGGLIGWFIVDPLNGAMYTLSPDQVSSALGGEVGHNNSAADGSISVMLIEDVPESLLSQMTKIN